MIEDHGTVVQLKVGARWNDFQKMKNQFYVSKKYKSMWRLIDLLEMVLNN